MRLGPGCPKSKLFVRPVPCLYLSRPSGWRAPSGTPTCGVVCASIPTQGQTRHHVISKAVRSTTRQASASLTAFVNSPPSLFFSSLSLCLSFNRNCTEISIYPASTRKKTSTQQPSWRTMSRRATWYVPVFTPKTRPLCRRLDGISHSRHIW